MLSIMMSVGFFTLVERKLLALSQLRLGPNKLLFYGVGQPLADALKLMKKPFNMNMKISPLMFNFFCSFMLMMSMSMWVVIPFKNWKSSKSLAMFWILMIISLSSFSILIMGWTSASKYPFMGSVRSICQTISLEVLITLLLQSYFLIFSTMSMSLHPPKGFCMSLLCYFVLFLVIFLMETQRAPFDISEGESEIVSGYNTEFSSILFILIFLSEYMNLLMMIYLMKFLFLWPNLVSILSVMLLFVIIRSAYPRIRYDLLMAYSWLKLLPASIFISLFAMNLKFLL